MAIAQLSGERAPLIATVTVEPGTAKPMFSSNENEEEAMTVHVADSKICDLNRVVQTRFHKQNMREL